MGTVPDTRADRTITNAQSWLPNASSKLGDIVVSALAGAEIKARRGAGLDNCDLKVNIQTAGHGRGCTARKSKESVTGHCTRIYKTLHKDPSKCMFWYEVFLLAEQYPAGAGPHRLMWICLREDEKKPSLLPSLCFSQCFHSVSCSSASVLDQDTITEGPEIPCLF